MARPQRPGHSASAPKHRLCSLDIKFTGQFVEADANATPPVVGVTGKEHGERLARIETKLNEAVAARYPAQIA